MWPKRNQGNRGPANAKAGIDDAGGRGAVQSILAAIPQRVFDVTDARHGAGPRRKHKIDVRSLLSGLDARSGEPNPERVQFGSGSKIAENPSHVRVRHRAKVIYVRAEQTSMHASNSSRAQRHPTHAEVVAAPSCARASHYRYRFVDLDTFRNLSRHNVLWTIPGQPRVDLVNVDSSLSPGEHLKSSRTLIDLSQTFRAVTS